MSTEEAATAGCRSAGVGGLVAEPPSLLDSYKRNCNTSATAKPKNRHCGKWTMVGTGTTPKRTHGSTVRGTLAGAAARGKGTACAIGWPIWHKSTGFAAWRRRASDPHFQSR